ncbi:MAG: hypothetical protein QM682_10910 [Paracoccus sp. (in: a-proteobacteria)]|uniref:hypothetical protein n=1 Tax=Paracoccus sp. TaxID=267 RepID=UPI0039E5644E
MAAALRLDSFAVPLPAAGAPSQADLDRAYHDGLEQGLHQGREASLDALTAELSRLRQGLKLADADARQIRHEALQAVAPALALIIDLLGPAGARERLLGALRQELAHLVDHAEGASLRVRCGPDLAPDVRECLRRAGLHADLVIDPHQAGIELGVNGGAIRFDPAAPAKQLHAIIDELNARE